MFYMIITIVGVLIFYLILSHLKLRRQLTYIEKFPFPEVLRKKLSTKHAQLNEQQLSQVIQGLRDYFYICRQAKRRSVAMPSQVVDDAWHEFILYTRCYHHFCHKALGWFLHHTPTEVMPSPLIAQEGIKRAWRLSCAKDKINPNTPNRLPLLFALDDMLAIKNGFKYSLNCTDKSSPLYGDSYCASHINCASGCAGDSAALDSDGGFGGSDCGSGCGGD